MIRIGILGYGNLGKGTELALKQNPDMELVAIFTRRAPKLIKTYTDVKVISIDEIENWIDKIDVMILCGGSKNDLLIQTPKYAKLFNTVDSFDMHSEIPNYFEKVNKSAKESGKVSIISVGWDPGLFSINRLYAESILPEGNTYTFWGKGVSQGHSNAIKKISGVKNAIQYTIPREEAVKAVKNGENPNLSTREKHLRECFVVVEENADKEIIEKEIKEMPNYFSEYDTIVHFINDDEFKEKHTEIFHGGFLFRSCNTGLYKKSKQTFEFSLNLESNPEFTSCVLVAYARAAYRLSKKNCIGARTVLDIPVSMLSMKTHEEILKNIL